MSERARTAREALADFKARELVPRRLREQYGEGAVPAELVEAYAGKLGSRRPGARKLKGGAVPEGIRRAAEVNREKAKQYYQEIYDLIILPAYEDGKGLRSIARRLDELGHTTRRGKRWSGVQISRVLRLYAGP
jgi:hypothetical protein